VDIIKDVFRPVAQRVKSRADSLVCLKNVPACGIEGWLKIEAAAALGDRFVKFQNKGPDLLLKDDFKVELKAAGGLGPAWIVSGLKYEHPCLFLCGHAQQQIIERLRTNPKVSQLVYEIFFPDRADRTNPWIIGVAVPK